MAATQPNSLLDRADDNLFSDINNIQDQIGDLYLDIITNYGDFFEIDNSLFDNVFSDYDLVKSFEYFKNKLLSIANKYSIIFPGIEDIGGGQIKINVNGPVMRHDGNGLSTSNPIKIGDKFIISETDSVYDNTELNIYTVTGLDNVISPNAIIINETFFGNLSSLPKGNLIFLDGSAGRILQHGIELLPGGSIIPIFGEFKTTNEVNANIKGLNSCPSGYKECDGSLINNINSIFNQQYIVDLRGLFIHGENKGLNTTLNNNFSGNIGSIQGQDHHLHKMNDHVHSFEHEHPHGHTYNHTHKILIHKHGINSHKHTIEEHSHTVIDDGNKQTGFEKLSSHSESGLEYNDTTDTDQPGPKHKHRLDGDIDTNSISNNSVLTYNNSNPYSGTSNQVNTGSTTAIINFNIGSDVMTTDPNFDTASPTLNINTNIYFSLPKFKSVKFCMKL